MPVSPWKKNMIPKDLGREEHLNPPPTPGIARFSRVFCKLHARREDWFCRLSGLNIYHHQQAEISIHRVPAAHGES
jgi:hypothetical protein